MVVCVRVLREQSSVEYKHPTACNISAFGPFSLSFHALHFFSPQTLCNSSTLGDVPDPTWLHFLTRDGRAAVGHLPKAAGGFGPCKPLGPVSPAPRGPGSVGVLFLLLAREAGQPRAEQHGGGGTRPGAVVGPADFTRPWGHKRGRGAGAGQRGRAGGSATSRRVRVGDAAGN